MGKPTNPTAAAAQPSKPLAITIQRVLNNVVVFGVGGFISILAPKNLQFLIYGIGVLIGGAASMGMKLAAAKDLGRWLYVTLALTLTFAAGTIAGSALWLTLGPGPLAQRLAYLPVAALLIGFAAGSVGRILLSEDNRIYPIAQSLEQSATSVVLMAVGVALTTMGVAIAVGVQPAWDEVNIFEVVLGIVVGVTLILMGFALTAAGVAFLAMREAVEGVISLAVSVGGVALGVALLFDGGSASGVALIAVGVAIIALGVAIMGESESALSVTLTGLGAATAGLGVTLIVEGLTALGVALTAEGLAIIAVRLSSTAEIDE